MMVIFAVTKRDLTEFKMLIIIYLKMCMEIYFMHKKAQTINYRGKSYITVLECL